MLRLCFLFSFLHSATAIEHGGCDVATNCDAFAQHDDGTSLFQQVNRHMVERDHGGSQMIQAIKQANPSLNLLEHGEGVGREVSTLEAGLRDWASKAAAGEKLPEGFMSIVDGILEGLTKIINGVQTEHSNDVALMKSAEDLFIKCGNDTAEAHSKADGIDERAYAANEYRKTHNTCRVAEKAALAAKTQACDTFDQFSTSARSNVPDCTANAMEDAKLFEYLQKVKQFGADYTPEDYEEKKNACQTTTATYSHKKNDCNSAQDTFELGFCAHESLLSQTCSEQISCRQRMGNNLDMTCGIVQSNAQIRQTEYASAKKAECYVGVLKIDEKRIDEKNKKFKECEEDVSVLNLEMVCPVKPAAAACDTSVVQEKPCTSTWLNTEYTTKSWYDTAPAKSCTECPAPPQRQDAETVQTVQAPVEAEELWEHGGWTFYKVSTSDTSEDAVKAACLGAGLANPCAGDSGCTYTGDPSQCTFTSEVGCGSPMGTTSRAKCGGYPSNCAKLKGVYTYMGHKWSGSCGVHKTSNSWCDVGSSSKTGFAFCALQGKAQIEKYKVATANSKSCPSGYRTMTHDECKAGASVGGSSYDYGNFAEPQCKGHDGSQHAWPGAGCFKWGNQLFYSNCADRALTLDDRVGVCTSNR